MIGFRTAKSQNGAPLYMVADNLIQARLQKSGHLFPFACQNSRTTRADINIFFLLVFEKQGIRRFGASVLSDGNEGVIY